MLEKDLESPGTRLFRPVKHPVTVRLDADVLEWLRSQGPGYQTRINRTLRGAMAAAPQTGSGETADGELFMKRPWPGARTEESGRSGELTVEDILKGESLNLEFKQARPKDSLKYLKSVVAFANGKGGRIVFGVEDRTREVVGLPEDEVFAEMDALASAICDGCEPAIVPDIYAQSVGGKPVIVVEISPGRLRPYRVKSLGLENGVYIRVAGTSRPAPRELSAEMYWEREGRSYDRVVRADLLVSEEEVADLCGRMKDAASAFARSEEQRRRTKELTKNVLLSWGLLEEDAGGALHPTNGYQFLLGRDPRCPGIQCAAFKGNSRAVFIDRREFGGPLWEQVSSAFDFVLRHICLRSRLVGVYRQDMYELPPDELRELIVNAVMNCSCLQEESVKVAVFDDRVEIISPGGLMPVVTVEKMKAGYSKIRNKAIARAFMYLNLAEAWGSGIPKLLRAAKEYGLPEPEFTDSGTEFKVTLLRAKEAGDGRFAGGREGGPLFRAVPEASPAAARAGFQEVMAESRRQEREAVLAAIRANPSVTVSGLAALAGFSRARVRRVMEGLREDGVLRREGSTKKGKWLLKE